MLVGRACPERERRRADARQTGSVLRLNGIGKTTVAGRHAHQTRERRTIRALKQLFMSRCTKQEQAVRYAHPNWVSADERLPFLRMSVFLIHSQRRVCRPRACPTIMLLAKGLHWSYQAPPVGMNAIGVRGICEGLRVGRVLSDRSITPISGSGKRFRHLRQWSRSRSDPTDPATTHVHRVIPTRRGTTHVLNHRGGCPNNGHRNRHQLGSVRTSRPVLGCVAEDRQCHCRRYPDGRRLPERRPTRTQPISLPSLGASLACTPDNLG